MGVVSSTKDFIKEIGKEAFQRLHTESLSVALSCSYNAKTLINMSYRTSEDAQENINPETGKFYDVEIIGKIQINPNEDRDNIINRITALFAHELLHSYEDYNLTKKSSTMYDAADKYEYFNNDRQVKGIDKQKFANILYYLTPIETRAYTAQIIKEIEPKIKYCSNSQEAFNLLQGSVIWKNYLTIEDWLDMFSQPWVNDEIKRNIENWWAETTGKPTAYGNIVNRMNRMFERTKKKIVQNVSKRIYDKAIKDGLWGLTHDDDELLIR